MNSLVIDIKNLANKTVLDKGFEVIGVELLTNLNPMNVQLQIRRKGGGDVSLDDCALLSASIGDALENSRLFENPYVLEISSPGLNEILINERDFKTFKGFPVEVIIQNKNKSEIRKIGLLHERSKDHLKLNNKGQVSVISLEDVIEVRLTSPKG